MRDKIFYSICFLLVLIFGVFWNGSGKEPPEVFEKFVGDKVGLFGLIVDPPEMREKNQRFVIEVKHEEVETKVLVSAGSDYEFQYGDVVEVSGKFKKPSNFIGDSGKEFDYINYLKKDGIYYKVDFAEVVKISSGNGSALKRVLFNFKNKLLEKVDYAVPKTEGLLLSGLILGERAEFPAEMREEFIRTGTIHIVALSGYNISIVAGWFARVLNYFSPVVSLWGTILSIILFVLMTGASSTGVRAGIMAGLVLLAKYTGRTYDAGRALVLAGTIMVLINPMVLLYDVSFQLSFIATFAIIFLSPKMKKHFYFLTKRFHLREIITDTFSAYIFVLPFILYKMGNLSFVALPANILVLPFIPLTMMLGFMVVFSGFFSGTLSLIFGFITSLFLKYELFTIHFFSSLPFASFTLPNFPLVLVILIYVGFIYFVFGKKFSDKTT